MQRAEVVLGALRKRAKSRRDAVFPRLYRHLFNPDLYLNAKTCNDDIEKIIVLLRTEAYYPGRTGGRQASVMVEHALARLLVAAFGLGPEELDEDEAPSPDLRKLQEAAGVRWALVGGITHTDACTLGRFLETRVRDGRVQELARRILKTGEGRGPLPDVLRRACLEELDRVVAESGEVLAYVRRGTSFLAVGRVKPERLYRAVSGFFPTRPELVDLARERPVFLGYQVAAGPEGCRLLVPAGSLRERLRDFTRENRSVHRADRVDLPVERIIDLYRQELAQIGRDYALAHDGARQLARFRHYHLGSLVKTLARKEQASARAILEKYRVVQDGKSTIGVRAAAGMVSYPARAAPGKVPLVGDWRAGCIERCTPGSEGGAARPAHGAARHAYPTRLPQL